MPSLRCSLLFVAAGLLTAASAVAQPTLGFREEFPAMNGTGTWAGGAITSNPGTGGLGGINDGYLVVSRDAAASLGTVSFGSEYQGDWTTTGITQIRVWLTDHGVDQQLEIHIGIGNMGNFWQYNPGWLPPSGAWAEYVADLSSSAGWTRIIGTTGTFIQALQGADRLHLRHDTAPYIQQPNALLGDFGMDHVVLTNGTVGIDGGGPRAGSPIDLAPPFPNPSRGPVTLSIAQREAGPVRIEVVDVGGRRVRAAELPPASAGPRLWLWDGRDDRGARVAPGAYRVRATGPSGGTSRSLVRID